MSSRCGPAVQNPAAMSRRRASCSASSSFPASHVASYVMCSVSRPLEISSYIVSAFGASCARYAARRRIISSPASAIDASNTSSSARASGVRSNCLSSAFFCVIAR